MKANGKAWSWQQSNKNLELLWKYQKTKSVKSINGDKGKKQKQTHELYGIFFSGSHRPFTPNPGRGTFNKTNTISLGCETEKETQKK